MNNSYICVFVNICSVEVLSFSSAPEKLKYSRKQHFLVKICDRRLVVIWILIASILSKIYLSRSTDTLVVQILSLFNSLSVKCVLCCYFSQALEKLTPFRQSLYLFCFPLTKRRHFSEHRVLNYIQNFDSSGQKKSYFIIIVYNKSRLFYDSPNQFLISF